MITVPECTKRIIERSRYLSEALSKDLINTSSLARYIKPELESMLIKKITTPSVVMAIKRAQRQLKPKYKEGNIFKSPPQMMVKSGMFLITLQRTKETEETIGTMFLNRIKGTFSSISIGATEIQIVGSDVVLEKISQFQKDNIISSLPNISQVTIYLPEEAIKTPGVYYFFLKSLAWEGVNIVGSATTLTEFSLFFEDKNVNRAFEILSSLFTKDVI